MSKNRRDGFQRRRQGAEAGRRGSERSGDARTEKTEGRRLARIHYPMDRDQKKILLENLYAALSIAITALIICSLAYLAELRDTAAERGEIARVSGAIMVADSPLGAADISFRHVYALQLPGGRGYGAIVRFGGRGSTAHAAVIMNSAGVLVAAQPLDSTRPNLVFNSSSWFSRFKGSGGAGRAFAADVSSIRPDEEDTALSLIESAGTLNRLSAFVRAHVSNE